MEGAPAMTGLHMDAFGTSQAVTGDVFTAPLRAGVDRDEKTENAIRCNQSSGILLLSSSPV